MTEWACVAVFEFEAGPTEQRILHRGDKKLCLAVAERLEAVYGAVAYRGARSERVVGVALAVCRVSALDD